MGRQRPWRGCQQYGPGQSSPVLAPFWNDLARWLFGLGSCCHYIGKTGTNSGSVATVQFQYWFGLDVGLWSQRCAQIRFLLVSELLRRGSPCHRFPNAWNSMIAVSDCWRSLQLLQFLALLYHALLICPSASWIEYLYQFLFINFERSENHQRSKPHRYSGLDQLLQSYLWFQCLHGYVLLIVFFSNFDPDTSQLLPESLRRRRSHPAPSCRHEWLLQAHQFWIRQASPVFVDIHRSSSSSPFR